MRFWSKLKRTFSDDRLDVKARFEIQRQAISGTMSKFCVARDRKTGHVVGLKLLDKEKTAAFEARFAGLNKPSEGEIAVRLAHPNLVTTYEHGRTTDDVPYLVMELLPGPDVNSLLIAKDKRLEGQRLDFLRQAGEGIAAMHAVGFLHRDICPRNLMLAADGRTLKVIDFGLAIPATEPFFRAPNRTGNPNYLAPEIVRRRKADHRVDVFAFGATAYEILASQLPWPPGTTGQAAMSHEQPPADLRRHRPMLDPKLVELIHWSIEPDESKRCPSISEFLARLRAIPSMGHCREG
jgi:serine/threonine-protein kinase